MTTTTEPYDETVQQAVARENARRKRVFLAFLALLLVPVAIGAYALTKAPTETAKVVNDVTPLVTERVGAQIVTRVTNDVQSRAEPIIRGSVARAITAEVEPRISTATKDLRQDIKDLQTTAQETSDFVAAAKPQLTSITGFEDRLGKLAGSIDQTGGLLQTLRTDQDRLRQEIATERDFTQGLTKTIERVNGQINNVSGSQQQFVDLRRTTTKELELIRALANRSAQTADANKEAIASLTRRLSALEAELKRLQVHVPTNVHP